MPLTFLEAIDEIIKTEPVLETPVTIDEWLNENVSSEVAALVRKDLTSGDVHVGTALGNEKDKKKKKPISTIGEGKHVEAGAEKRFEFDIKKTDADEQLVFGWASVSTIDDQLVVDKQDDMIAPEDLEKAAYDFTLYFRSQGDMHEKRGVGRLVESMMFTKQKQKLLGIDLRMEGWWVGFKVDDAEMWKAIKSGDRPEFSIGGRADRIEV